MAGTIIADTIQATSQQISLNVGNTTILTASSTGLTLIPSNNVNINVTNSTVAFGSGNVTNPSISFSGNTSTGMYMPVANAVAWTTAGAETMRITAAGNFGVGVTSPQARIHSTKAGAEAARFTNSNSNGGDWEFKLGGGGFIDRTFMITDKYGGADDVRFAIDSGGNVLFNCTTLPGGSDAVYAKIIKGPGEDNVMRSHVGVSGSKPHFYFFNTNGLIGNISTSGSATSYNTSSDYRLKNNIAPMTGALEKVALLKPVTYKWKADGSSGQGFIAHELAEVVPGCVTGEKDAVSEQQYEVTPAVKNEEGYIVTEAVMGTRIEPVYQGVDTSFLVATLTAAIQELKVIVDAQAVEIAALKAK